MSKYKTLTQPIPVEISEYQTVDIEFTSWENCFFCKHWHKSDTCDAFNDGIPNKITEGKSDHFKPLPDQDNNIVFEPMEDSNE